MRPYRDFTNLEKHNGDDPKRYKLVVAPCKYLYEGHHGEIWFERPFDGQLSEIKRQ
jgi:hypothetical protein